MHRETLILCVCLVVLCLGTGSAIAMDTVIQVYTDKTSYRPGHGDMLNLSVMGDNNGPGIYVDAHIAIVAPNGVIYEVPSWATDFTPLLGNVFLPQGFYFPESHIGSYPVGSFPMTQSGKYLAVSAFTRPDTLKYASEIHYAPFSVEGADCQFTINLDEQLDGSWTSDCASKHRGSGYYANYYVFTLLTSVSVAIDLTSLDDTYMYLLEGSGSDGSVIHEDDDGGAGNNSHLALTLAGGTYTIETTTYYKGRTGSFAVSLARTGDDTPSDAINILMGHSIEAAILPEGDADWYKFDVGAREWITIETTGNTDTVIYWYDSLRDANNNNVAHWDDNAGEGLNARITLNADWAATIYVEVCGHSSSDTGSYRILLHH